MSADFERIYAETCERLSRYLRSILPDPEERQDCFQEAYLRLWRSSSRELPLNPGAWLVVVARRIALARAGRPRPATAGADEIAVGRPPSLRLEVEEALAALGEAQRETFCLRHFGGLSYAEIAAELRIPIGTVASRIHEALAVLRRELVGELEPKEG